MAQAVVGGQVHLEDAAGRPSAPVPDGLHSWNRSHIVPGHGFLGHMTPLGPIYGPGLSEGVADKGY